MGVDTETEGEMRTYLIKAGNWSYVEERKGQRFHLLTNEGETLLVTRSLDHAIKAWRAYEQWQEYEERRGGDEIISRA